MGKTFKTLVAICAGFALVAAGYLNYRNSKIERLYAEAAGDPQFFRNTSQSTEAARQLATYRGARSTDWLLALAVQGNLLAPEAQTEAIRALAKRNDPKIAPALASLLQPHEGLKTRQTVAVALKDLPCKGECILSILYYLERIWRGDPNGEDRYVLPAGNEEVAAGYRRGQEEVYANLYSVLQREKFETLGALIKLHGVGTSDPTSFALDLLSRLQLREACRYLLQSDRQLRDLSPEFYKAPREELQAAIASLKCK